MDLYNWVRAALLGVIEGITEWLPVSSTGHLILFDAFFPGDETVFTDAFMNVFDVFIQIGAIFSVLTVFYRRLNPFSQGKTEKQKKNTAGLWKRVLLAVLPSIVFGALLDGFFEKHLMNPYIVPVTLLLYGVLFILVEKTRTGEKARYVTVMDMPYKVAFLIGLFQVLSIVPGTSRAGVTILGALLLYCSRYVAAEFSFFLAVPTLFGAGVLKMFKYFVVKQLTLSTIQWVILFMVMLIAYAVSMVIVQWLLKFLKRHTLIPFGIYRIALGILVFVFFVFSR